MRVRRLLTIEGGGDGAGSAPGASAGAPPATGTPSPSAGAASAFDWKTSGLDDAGMAIVTERGWKAPGDLLTSYRNLETAVGVPPERLIKLPAQRDAGDPKAWEPVWKQLGRPESADKYAIPVPEGDKGEFAKVARDWFHGANLTQSQVTALATKWNEHIKSQQDSMKTATEAKNLESVNKLKSEWGPQYEANAAVVDRAAEAFGMNQEQLNGLKQVLGPHGAMTFLHNIGSKLGVEGAPKGIETGGGEGFTGMTPQQAQAKLDQLKGDRTFSQRFTSEDPKDRADARAEIKRLSLIAYPGSHPA